MIDTLTKPHPTEHQTNPVGPPQGPKDPRAIGTMGEEPNELGVFKLSEHGDAHQLGHVAMDSVLPNGNQLQVGSFNAMPTPIPASAEVMRHAQKRHAHNPRNN